MTSKSTTGKSTEDRLAAAERALKAAGLDPDKMPEWDQYPKRVLSETVEMAAGRLGITASELRTICEALAHKPQEIQGVCQTSDGLTVDTGGVTMVLRPADKPDADGNTGWTRLQHPSPEVESHRAANCSAVPVFAGAPEDAA